MILLWPNHALILRIPIVQNLNLHPFISRIAFVRRANPNPVIRPWRQQKLEPENEIRVFFFSEQIAAALFRTNNPSPFRHHIARTMSAHQLPSIERFPIEQRMKARLVRRKCSRGAKRKKQNSHTKDSILLFAVPRAHETISGEAHSAKAVNNRYHMISRWRFKASPEEIYTILNEPVEYPRWWPSVYLSVRQLAPGRVRLHTRGLLPYTLTWTAQTTESRPPHRIVIKATGDFEGTGEWSILPDGEEVDVTFDWKLRIQKPLLRYLTFALRPAFEANHRWAMEQGRRSLELELARYRANSVEEMNNVPPPPGVFDGMRREVIAGSILALAVAVGIIRGPR